MFRGRVRIPEVCQVRHSSIQHVLLEALLDGLTGRAGTVQLQKLCEGKGIDHKLHIAARKIGRQLARKELCVRPRDVNIAIQGDAQGIHAFFPVLHFLDFIKEQVRLALNACCPLLDLRMQRFGVLKMGIAHIFKIDGDELRRSDAGCCELLLDQFQHDRLAAAANPGHHLDQLRADKRTDAAHVHFSLDHGFRSLLFYGWH